MHTDPFDAENLAPDLGQDLLCSAAGSDELAVAFRRSCAGLGESPPVDFPSWGTRQLVRHDEVGRQHGRRKPLEQEAPQLRGGRSGLGASRHVGGQLGVAALVGSGDHHGFRHVGMPTQRDLDLAGLDPDAADLHLAVLTSEVLDVAVGLVAGQIACAIEHFAGVGGERVGDEPGGRQVRLTGVAAPHAGSADVQLARHAHRDRLEIGVEKVNLRRWRLAARSGSTGRVHRACSAHRWP